MLEEYLKTIEIIKNQKNNLTKKSTNPVIDLKDLNEIIIQICNIDSKMVEYTHLIEKEKDININKPENKFNKNKLHKKDHNSNVLNNEGHIEKNQHETDNSIDSDNNNDNLNHKTKKNKTYKIELDAEIVDKIIKLKGKTIINIKQPNNNIETIYTFKNKIKKF